MCIGIAIAELVMSHLAELQSSHLIPGRLSAERRPITRRLLPL